MKGHGRNELHRTLSLNAKNGAPKNLGIRIAGPETKQLGSLLFEAAGRVQIEVAKSEVAKPMLTEQGLFLRLNLKRGDNRVGVKYVWK